jgi:dual oxidase
MFQGSEVAYIYGCIVLCFVPLLAILGAYGVVKLMNARRRKMKQVRGFFSKTFQSKVGITHSLFQCLNQL